MTTSLKNEHKYQTFSIASLALLSALVMPKAGAGEAYSLLPSTMPYDPPVASESFVREYDTGYSALPSLEEFNFSSNVDSKSSNTEPIGNDNSPSFLGWAAAGSVAVLTVGRELAIQGKNLFYRYLIEGTAKKLWAKGSAEPATCSTPVSLFKLDVCVKNGRLVPKQSEIPFRPATIKDLFPGGNGMKEFLAAFNKCSPDTPFPTILLCNDKKEPLRLRTINQAIWEAVANELSPNRVNYLNSATASKKSKYLIIPVCNVSDEKTDGRRFEILLLGQNDISSLFKIARNGNSPKNSFLRKLSLALENPHLFREVSV